jgi:hypothetical protein
MRSDIVAVTGETALEAEQLAGDDRIKAAFGKWALIFKDYFPAYE